MTSSNSPWSGSGAESAVRAPRWAPSELHSEPSGTTGPTQDTGGRPAPVDPVEAARVEAFQRGFEQGQRTEAEKMAPAVAALKDALTDMQTAHPAWLDNVEKNLITLAVAVARQVVGQELKTDPDSIRQLVSRALTRFPIEVPVTIRLHPSDLSRISAATLESTNPDPAAGRDVRWRADVLIAEGSCVVEGPERMVDGRVDKALLRIYQALATDDRGLVQDD